MFLFSLNWFQLCVVFRFYKFLIFVSVGLILNSGLDLCFFGSVFSVLFRSCLSQAQGFAPEILHMALLSNLTYMDHNDTKLCIKCPLDEHSINSDVAVIIGNTSSSNKSHFEHMVRIVSSEPTHTHTLSGQSILRSPTGVSFCPAPCSTRGHKGRMMNLRLAVS